MNFHNLNKLNVTIPLYQVACIFRTRHYLPSLPMEIPTLFDTVTLPFS
jgi:hypothetical protein